MDISTQYVAFEQEIMMQNPYAIGFKERRSTLNYRNGFSHALKKIKSRAKNALGFQQSRCPDGEEHHPSVCLRGWRGDVCEKCPFTGV
jgi:hypothetical protein